VTPEVDARLRARADWAPLLDATRPPPTTIKVITHD
jgi:outer membrane protein, multidrug efflux system